MEIEFEFEEEFLSYKRFINLDFKNGFSDSFICEICVICGYILFINRLVLLCSINGMFIAYVHDCNQHLFIILFFSPLFLLQMAYQKMLILRNFPQYILYNFSFILLFTASFFYTSPAFSGNEKAYEREYIVKAGFIYNFTKFIKWPEEALHSEDSEFFIGVMGSDPFGNILDTIAAKKKIQGRNLVIKRFSSLDEIETCHILFVSSSEKDHLEEVLSKLRGSQVLIVGDTPGFAKRGVGINFYIKKNKVRIEFNKRALEKSGLKVSSQLLNIGRIIK